MNVKDNMGVGLKQQILVAAFELTEGGPTTIRFDDLAPERKVVEIWLPPRGTVELRALRVDDGASVDAAPDDRRRWVHYGSSISHCMEAEAPLGT